VAGQSTGHETSVLIPGESDAIPAHYAIRELAGVQPSHNGHTFSQNVDYAHANERDYNSRAMSLQRVYGR
jgi:hypothetical protein